MTYESDQAGVLETVAGEGDTLAVGALIAHIGEGGAGRAQDAGAPLAGTEEEPAAGPAGVRAEGETIGAGGSQQAAASAGAPAGEDRPAGERIRASPLAKRMARESGVDLQSLTGSGPGGRIVKADVQSAGTQPPASAAPAVPAATSSPGATTAPGATAAPATGIEGVATAKGETTAVELTRTQQTIARRMAESKATIPDFTLQVEVDMEDCVKLRSDLKRLSQSDAPTYNDMVVKASALALREHPHANGSYRDGGLQLHSRVNVGVAVAADEALVVPTVFDAEEKSLGEIARETRTLAARVRDGTITPPELGGGTFTVSNLGMYGVRSFTAIINPPQSAILSVGSLEPRAVVRDGEVVARHTMILTLACDHRILYGANAAQFLARIRELLEAPSALTL
jgi:pyruvate dehydrogenase E2 component (dihydrolipoamide acetyltransferase)